MVDISYYPPFLKLGNLDICVCAYIYVYIHVTEIEHILKFENIKVMLVPTTWSIPYEESVLYKRQNTMSGMLQVL